MIARHWKGIAKPEEAENYVTHLKTDTFPHLATIPGFVRAYILKRPVAQGVEFLILTVWESMEAIAQFAGPKPDAAVVPPVAQAMMIDYDRNVSHYEVAETYAPGPVGESHG
ncbi:MAG: antibiotic biosynthesis monooxygenase [Desulfomonile tiedjei]|nr:antibiotic biosynthesis monooxygenase [Desulfomonile tiedjei]